MTPAVGHRRPVPTIDANRVFGPARYSLAEQAASPEKPMTRVVKDVLSVGRWNIGGPQSPKMWDVTAETLQAITRSFAAQQDSGHAINIGMSHGGDGMLVPTSELVATIDAVRVSGNWLWMSAYVTPMQARALQNPAFKVSPGLMWDYYDGSGQQHSIAMVHAAITDRPVVAGQGAFIAMANVAHSTKPLSVRDRANVELMGLGLSPVPSHISESAIPAFMASVRRATSPRHS